MKNELLYIGHRGTNFKFDENTIEAFKKVVDLGVDCIELDIRQSKDNKYFIMHNPEISISTNGNGLIKNLTTYDLQKIKSKYYNCCIPTLEMVFETFQSKVNYILDIKVRKIFHDVMKIVERYKTKKSIIICSANIQDLLSVKKCYPDLKNCFVIYQKNKLIDIIRKVESKQYSINLNILSLSSKIVTKEAIKICKKLGISVFVWGFWYYKTDPIPIIKSHIDDGVNGILFDNYENISKIKKWMKLKKA